MSADNGIWVASFGGRSFRVVESSMSTVDCINHEPNTRDGFNAIFIVRIFGNAATFESELFALNEANELERATLDGDFGVLEWGIQRIDFKYSYSYYEMLALSLTGSPIIGTDQFRKRVIDRISILDQASLVNVAEVLWPNSTIAEAGSGLMFVEMESNDA